ncbi:MAG: hypothetical protein ACLPXM_17860 [Terriglobales bacterium]
MNRRILVLFCVAFLAQAARASESLVYAVSTGETKPSQALPKTEIFIVDSESGKQRLVFSDADTELLLLPGSDVQSDIVAAGGRIFSRGVERKLYTNGRSDSPAAVFELPTSRSGKARKIFDIENEVPMGSNFRNLFISPTGAKIGYMKVINGKPYLFLHETSTGKLLRKMDLSQMVFDLFVTSIGWMPDGERLFFTLDRSDEDDNWRLPESQVGSYVMKEDGSGLARIAPEAAMHPKRPGLQANAVGAAVVLGALPDGRYLLRDFQVGPPSAHPGTYLYTLDPLANTQKTLSTDVPGELRCFRLSRSGRKLALLATEQESNTTEVSTGSKAVSVFDVESGQGRKLFYFTIKPDGPAWIDLIGWLGHR